MKKKLTAAILSVVMLLMSGSVFAAGTETAEESKYSGEYGAFEQMAKYVAERYIDDSLTEEEIMKQGLSKLLENNDPLLVQLLIVHKCLHHVRLGESLDCFLCLYYRDC